MSLALLLTVYPCFSCLLLYVKLHMCLLKPPLSRWQLEMAE